MPIHQIRIDALEVDGLLTWTARATLRVHVLAGRATPESWWIEAEIRGRVEAAREVSITAQCADRTYRGPGKATEVVTYGEPTRLKVDGVGPLEGFDGTDPFS